MKHIFLRTRFITDFKQQARLALVFVFWSVILVLCLTGLFFINYATISTETGALSIHDKHLARLLLVEQAKQLALSYGLTMLAFIILMGLYIMAYANRMTGPIYKFNQILKKAAQDQEWPSDLRFRKADAFKELAKNFNEFVHTMKTRR